MSSEHPVAQAATSTPPPQSNPSRGLKRRRLSTCSLSDPENPPELSTPTKRRKIHPDAATASVRDCSSTTTRPRPSVATEVAEWINTILADTRTESEINSPNSDAGVPAWAGPVSWLEQYITTCVEGLRQFDEMHKRLDNIELQKRKEAEEQRKLYASIDRTPLTLSSGGPGCCTWCESTWCDDSDSDEEPDYYGDDDSGCERSEQEYDSDGADGADEGADEEDDDGWREDDE